jgi:hypothetical protein
VVHSTSRLAADEASAVRNQFDEQSGLPFLEVLSASEVESACRAWNHRWRNRIYTPWITLGMFCFRRVALGGCPPGGRVRR